VKVVAFDPGVTTGYAIGHIDEGVMYVRAGQEVWSHGELWKQLHLAEPNAIIAESFEFRQGSRKGLVLFSCELIGVLHLFCSPSYRTPSVPLYMQTAAKGKGYYTNQHLQAADVYTRGIPHGMDALRHLLHWFTFGAGYQYNKHGFCRYEV
jgi:hypothetical protein